MSGLSKELSPLELRDLITHYTLDNATSEIKIKDFCANLARNPVLSKVNLQSRDFQKFLTERLSYHLPSKRISPDSIDQMVCDVFEALKIKQKRVPHSCSCIDHEISVFTTAHSKLNESNSLSLKKGLVESEVKDLGDELNSAERYKFLKRYSFVDIAGEFEKIRNSNYSIRGYVQEFGSGLAWALEKSVLLVNSEKILCLSRFGKWFIFFKQEFYEAETSKLSANLRRVLTSETIFDIHEVLLKEMYRINSLNFEDLPYKIGAFLNIEVVNSLEDYLEDLVTETFKSL